MITFIKVKSKLAQNYVKFYELCTRPLIGKTFVASNSVLSINRLCFSVKLIRESKLYFEDIIEII